jgi:hypothetical protein
MSASEHINPKLFHGSAHYFQEGERVNPSESHGILFGELKDVPLSFASTNIARAREAASMKATRKGMLFAPVFEVTSEDDVASELENPKKGLVHPDDHVSKKGHIAGKLVDWGINRNINVEDWRG